MNIEDTIKEAELITKIVSGDHGMGVSVFRDPLTVEQEKYLAVTKVLQQIRDEYLSARETHRPMAGRHEGYAVILEELDELWDEVKANNDTRAKEEAIQVAAMALAFILEV
jgi:hypothetical protein